MPARLRLRILLGGVVLAAAGGLVWLEAGARGDRTPATAAKKADGRSPSLTVPSRDGDEPAEDVAPFSATATATARDVLMDPAPPKDAPGGPLGARIEAGRKLYLDSVYAPKSADKAKLRLEAFEKAVADLAAMGLEGIPVLLAWLGKEKNPHAKLLLLSAIARVDGSAGVEGALAALAAIDDPAIEHVFCSRLGRSEDGRDRAVAEEILRRDPDPERRADVLESARQTKDAGWAHRLLEQATEDPEPRMRSHAIDLAEREKNPLERATLERLATGDPDASVRERAIESFATTRASEFPEFARASVFTPRSSAADQLVAVRCLARSKEPLAREVLEEAATSSPYPEVRAQAALHARRLAQQKVRQPRGR
jgi:hypothetical protein